MSGQPRSRQNFVASQTWCEAKSDSDFRELTLRGQLLRRENTRECMFSQVHAASTFVDEENTQDI